MGRFVFLVVWLGGAAVAAAASPSGDWVGVYTCAQGVTDLDLRIVEQPDGLRAMFHFYADPANPGVPEGCFTMQGRHDAAERRGDLRPLVWRLQPPGYIPVAMAGTENVIGNVIFGRIVATPGCTNFILVRMNTPPERPTPCILS
jgi:hypothetical protein